MFPRILDLILFFEFGIKSLILFMVWPIMFFGKSLAGVINGALYEMDVRLFIGLANL